MISQVLYIFFPTVFQFMAVRLAGRVVENMHRSVRFVLSVRRARGV